MIANPLRSLAGPIAAALTLPLALSAGGSAIAFSNAPRVIVTHMQGESMLPNLRNGERLHVDTGAYIRTTPRRGDIVAFHPRLFATHLPTWIKRVVALPGETVAVRQGQVYINGRRATDTYTHGTAYYTYRAYRLPRGTYFLLGDNRNNSEDSHLLGPIVLKLIVGKVTPPH
jgi:signal peptidase I